MDEFDKFIKNEFFIIDSNNLNSVNQKLYGYIIQNFQIIFKDAIDERQLDGDGAYIFVKVDKDNITIFQDFNGSYGLYLYKNDDYFAISNSFLKLVEYLKNSYKLSFDEDFANALLSADLTSLAYTETLIKEIEVLPSNYIIDINKNKKSINFKEINYLENTIELDSKEGIETLDKWFFKWVNIFRSLKEKTNNLAFDLTGGFDSRIMIALLLSSNIDINKIKINSANDGKHTHIEDYKIASEIAEFFNFKLNTDPFSTKYVRFKDLSTPINISFYIKSGFHKQFYFKDSYSVDPVYWITGSGGETIRGYPYKTPNEYLMEMLNKASRLSHLLVNPSKNKIISSYDKLSKKYNILDKNSYELSEILYKDVRCRNHYGKSAIEEYLRNTIRMNPLLDPLLHKIKPNTEYLDDKLLIIAIIFVRYCPELLKFDFEGGRNFNKETIEYAKKINEQYSFKGFSNEFISGPDIHKIDYDIGSSINYIKKEDIDELLKKIFYSSEFEMKFKNLFSSQIYNKISRIAETKSFFPLSEVYAAISIININDCVYESNVKNYENIFDYFENVLLKSEVSNEKSLQLFAKLLCHKYMVGRIDIKNSGNKNLVKILNCSDDSANITFPDWFSDKKGSGMVVKSDACCLDLEVICINKGILDITLRSEDIRDINGNHFPVYIDFLRLKINDENFIESSKLVSHNKSFNVSKSVKDSEIINIHLEWLPFNSSSKYK